MPRTSLLLGSLLLLLSVASCRTEGNLLLHPHGPRQAPVPPLSGELPVLPKETAPSGPRDRPAGGQLVASTPTSASGQPGGDGAARSDWGLPGRWSAPSHSIPTVDGPVHPDLAYHGRRLNYFISHTYGVSTYYAPVPGNPSHTSTSPTRSSQYYLQQGDNSEAVRFRYSSLRRAIPQDDPASRYLDSYLVQKRAFNAVRWAGLGCLVGGIALLCTGNQPYTRIGGDLMLASAPVFVFGSILKGRAVKQNFHRAFWEYNGADWQGEHLPLP